jgi:hypothetical protein
MPPKKVTVKTGTGSTPNILVLLSKPKKSEAVETVSDLSVSSPATPATSTAPTHRELSHSDPLIQEYYASLTPNERMAHTIAMDKLGTSYDVSRTHGFLRWQKSRK